jgi:hypothetical protein
MNTVYIDMSMPSLPNVSQVMNDVMYVVAMARAKEWVRNDLPTVTQSAMPSRHNFSTGYGINGLVLIPTETATAALVTVALIKRIPRRCH